MSFGRLPGDFFFGPIPPKYPPRIHTILYIGIIFSIFVSIRYISFCLALYLFVHCYIYIYTQYIYIYILELVFISVYHVISYHIIYIYMIYIYISINLVIWPYIYILFWAQHLGSQSLGSSPGSFSSFGDNKQMIFKMGNHKPSRKYQIYVHSKINLSYFIIL